MLVWILFGTLVSAVTAQAQYFHGPISSSLAGTGRAATEPEEGILLNPAVLPHARGFSSALFYADGELAKGLGETGMGLSLIDNTEGVMMPGGLFYMRQRRSFPGLPHVDEQYVTASMGRFLTTHLAGGFSVHYRSIDEEHGIERTVWNGSVGLLWAPHPLWGLALVGDHLADRVNSDLPHHLQELPELGVGGVYLYQKIFRLRLDGVKALQDNPDNRWRLGLGFETFTNEYTVIRFGFESDDRVHRRFGSFGWAFVGPRLKIDYSFKKNVDSGNGAMHSVDFRIPF